MLEIFGVREQHLGHARDADEIGDIGIRDGAPDGSEPKTNGRVLPTQTQADRYNSIIALVHSNILRNTVICYAVNQLGISKTGIQGGKRPSIGPSRIGWL